jgi:hypothetical protein
MAQININIIIIILIYLSFIYYYYYKNIKREKIFGRFSETIALFIKAKETAYNKVFNEQILVHSSSGFRVNKNDIETTQALYIKFVFRFCGPDIINDLKIIHGDLDSVCATISNEFIQRVEQDESIITEKIIETNENEMEG